MAKLTAAQDRAIETVLYYLERAQAFIDHQETIVARRKYAKTTTLDFSNDNGEVCQSIAKDIGSDLVALSLAIHALKNFREFHSKDGAQ